MAENGVEEAFTFGRAERSELRAFPAGYFATAGMRVLQRGMFAVLVQRALLPATEILASDVRFSSFRLGFKKKYGIVQSRVSG